MRIGIIYWSGTGNTLALARALVEGVREQGGTPELLEVSAATAEGALAFDALALGCPAMGAEVLEEEAMEPFVEALAGKGLRGKRLALFGSYDWGDGEWMRAWEERMKEAGASLIGPGLIANNSPDAAALAAAKELGLALARG